MRKLCDGKMKKEIGKSVNTTSYYNTTFEPLQLAINFERKALAQERLILDCFINIKGQSTCVSPSWIYTSLMERGLIHEKTPLTSIRRAMSNLTKRGFLKKTHTKVMGLY